MTLLQRLPTIRSKLGSVIVFAVGMTLLLVFLILGVGFEVFTATGGTTGGSCALAGRARRGDPRARDRPVAGSRAA